MGILQRELDKAHIPYREVDQSQFREISAVESLAMENLKAVVVPDASSITAANNILAPIALARDSLGISNVTAFGYPEWQTYYNSIGSYLRKVEGTFYTTFFAEPESGSYKRFEKDFKEWYGHGLGSTFPRYSLLGYDTGRYFLGLLGRAKETKQAWLGVQSKFEFQENPGNANLKSNLGVFFVQFKEVGEARRY